MFCMKCGKPTEGGQTMCPECAAKYAAPAAAPVQEEVIQLNTGAPAPKKKKKKGLIAGILAAVVVAGAAVGVALKWDAIKGLFGGETAEPEATEAVKVYSTPEEHMIGVEEDAMNHAVDLFTDTYGALRDSVTPGTEMNSGTAEMHILMGEEITGLLEMALSYQGTEMELDWLNDVMLEVSAAQDGDLIQMDMGVGLGNTKVATISYLMDMAKNVMYMGVPELSSTYLEMDMTEVMDGMSIGELLAVNQEQYAQLQDAMPTEEEVQALLLKYAGVVLSKITKVDKQVVTITSGGKSQEVTQLTTQISEEDLMNICEEVLVFLKDDNVVMNMLEKMAALGGGYEEGQIAEEWKANIEATLEEIRATKSEASEENYVVATTYVDRRDDVVGRTIVIYTEGEAALTVLDYKQVTQDDTFAFEANVADGAMTIVGSGTKSGDLLSGTYTLAAEGQNILDLKVTNLNTKKLEEGDLCGTFLLTPAQEIVDEIVAEANIPASLVGEVAIELKLDNTDTSSSFEIRLLTDAKTLLGLTLASRMEERSVNAPAKTINVDATDEEGMEWLKSLDFDGIIDKLEEAGVPKDLTSRLKAYTSLLAFM